MGQGRFGIQLSKKPTNPKFFMEKIVPSLLSVSASSGDIQAYGGGHGTVDLTKIECHRLF
jgi:hypothetical protein